MMVKRRRRRASARGENKNLTYTSLDFSCWLASSLLGSSSMYLLTHNRKPTKAGNRVLSPRERAITSPPVRIIFHQLLTIIYLLCIGIVYYKVIVVQKVCIEKLFFTYTLIHIYLDRQGPCPLIYFGSQRASDPKGVIQQLVY